MICDATIEDGRGRQRECQLATGHYPATRHRSVLRDGKEVMEWTDDAEFAKPASTSPPKPTLTVTEYTVNALPPEQRVADWWVWNVYARHTRAGQWVVTDGHAYYDAAGQPHFSAREAGDHSRADALDLAQQVAVAMRINGETADQAAARILNATKGEAR
jgi:hypothetical protein